MSVEAPAGTQVVVRTIRLLKAFEAGNAEWQSGDLAEALDLPKSTTHRLLQTLVSEEFLIRRTDTRGYRLGPAAIALGAEALRSNDLRTLAHPELVELAKETGETATLEVLSGGEVLILDEVEGRYLVSAMADIGTRWPLHATSTGKAILAHLAKDVRSELLGRRLERFTRATVTDLKKFRRQLDTVKKRGYAVANEELEEGHVAVGSVLLGPLDEVLGAVSVGGPVERLPTSRHAELGEQVAQAAVALSRRLGHGG